MQSRLAGRGSAASGLPRARSPRPQHEVFEVLRHEEIVGQRSSMPSGFVHLAFQMFNTEQGLWALVIVAVQNSERSKRFFRLSRRAFEFFVQFLYSGFWPILHSCAFISARAG